MRAWHEIMGGFPAPGEPPRNVSDLEAWGWRDYAHRAVHGADPEARRQVAERVAQRLLSGGPVPEPVREWLAFVLGSLLQTDSVPTLFDGRPAVGSKRLRDWSALLTTMSRRREAHASETITDALGAVADELHWSYSKTRTMFYSKPFRVQWEHRSR